MRCVTVPLAPAVERFKSEKRGVSNAFTKPSVASALFCSRAGKPSALMRVEVEILSFDNTVFMIFILVVTLCHNVRNNFKNKQLTCLPNVYMRILLRGNK